jgi:hypothetical protein
LNEKKTTTGSMETCMQNQKKGGLRLQNEALLKNLDKKIPKQIYPWANLFWSQYYTNGRVLGNLMKGSFW